MEIPDDIKHWITWIKEGNIPDENPIGASSRDIANFLSSLGPFIESHYKYLEHNYTSACNEICQQAKEMNDKDITIDVLIEKITKLQKSLKDLENSIKEKKNNSC